MAVTFRAASSVICPAEPSFCVSQADNFSCRDVNLRWQSCSNWPKCSSLHTPSSRREHTPCGHFKHNNSRSDGGSLQICCDYTKAAVPLHPHQVYPYIVSATRVPSRYLFITLSKYISTYCLSATFSHQFSSFFDYFKLPVLNCYTLF